MTPPTPRTGQPTIDAGALRLRPFTTDDTAWVYRVSTDDLTRHYVRLPEPYLPDDAARFVEDIATGGWAQGDRAEFLAGDATAEVGYWVDPLARGRGVATLALRATCRWAFTHLRLELIEWRTEVGNVASRRVAEKAGFRIEATLRGRLRHRGHRVDAWVGSLCPHELLR